MVARGVTLGSRGGVLQAWGDGLVPWNACSRRRAAVPDWESRRTENNTRGSAGIEARRAAVSTGRRLRPVGGLRLRGLGTAALEPSAGTA